MSLYYISLLTFTKKKKKVYSDEVSEVESFFLRSQDRDCGQVFDLVFILK